MQVKIYTGTSAVAANQIASFSGTTLPPEVTVQSSDVFVLFVTDNSNVDDGFTADYTTGALSMVEYLRLMLFAVVSNSITSLTPASGPPSGGTTVTIAGSSLGSGSDITSVQFGGALATISSQTSTTVVAVTPSQLVGAVTVVIGSTSKGVTGKPAAFTYIVRM